MYTDISHSLTLPKTFTSNFSKPLDDIKCTDAKKYVHQIFKSIQISVINPEDVNTTMLPYSTFKTKTKQTPQTL